MIINKLDNVFVNLENGHKYALFDIKKGDDVIKYGNPIGHATADIKKGEHVHTHNLKTNLSDNLTYEYSGGCEYKSTVTDKRFSVMKEKTVT
jgi:altronate hydrolase